MNLFFMLLIYKPICGSWKKQSDQFWPVILLRFTDLSIKGTVLYIHRFFIWDDLTEATFKCHETETLDLFLVLMLEVNYPQKAWFTLNKCHIVK